MPVLGESAYGGYLLGMPGMPATHTYSNSRGSSDHDNYINKTVDNLVFGTAAVMNTATGVIGLASSANPLFVGVFQDEEKYRDRGYYAPKDFMSVFTQGDIWVKVDPAVVIIPNTATVYYIPTVGATLGFFTNSATNNVIVPARWQSKNHNGLAKIALTEWK